MGNNWGVGCGVWGVGKRNKYPLHPTPYTLCPMPPSKIWIVIFKWQRLVKLFLSWRKL
ncbi:MAG: hypothetical protein F6J93_39245 [Oscillatoria sp. SIO1A7]|nr:hypothetical protein [Oscillatoria sp. SIO1A7]